VFVRFARCEIKIILVSSKEKSHSRPCAGNIVMSGGADGKVVTWNAASGERLGEAEAGSGVIAIAALDGGRFVAGTQGGDVVFYRHHGGRGRRPRASQAHTATGFWILLFGAVDWQPRRMTRPRPCGVSIRASGLRI
jgi:hypothetical protein